jgi:hypothetical protein
VLVKTSGTAGTMPKPLVPVRFVPPPSWYRTSGTDAGKEVRDA